MSVLDVRGCLANVIGQSRAQRGSRPMRFGVSIAAICIGLCPILLAAEDADRAESQVSQAIEFRSPIFATYGPAIVTDHELDASLSMIPEDDRIAFMINRRRLSERLDGLILSRLFHHQATESGLYEDPLMQARLYHALVETSAFLYRNHLRDLQDEDLEGLARELYLSDPSQFVSAPTVDFEHLLIARGSRTEVESARLLVEVYEQMQAGRAFEELIEAYSDDAGHPEGGYLGAALSELDEDFARVLTELPAGQRVIGPFLTSLGWHMVRINGRHAGEIMEWEEARESALRVVRRRQADRIEQRVRQRLLDGHEIRIGEENVRALFRRYGIEHLFEFEE